MAALLDLDWLFYVAAGLLVVAALWLLWRGLLADQSKGRARCPRCWYDLGALLPLPMGEGGGEGSSRAAFASITCPECGRVVKRERQLFRTRRRWWVVVGGMVVAMLAAAALMTPKVRRDGVWVVMPTWMLVTIDESVLAGAERPVGLTKEIHARLLQPDVPDWAVERFVLGDRCSIQFRATWPENLPLLGRIAPSRLVWDVGIREPGGPIADSTWVVMSNAAASPYPRYSYELAWADRLESFGLRGPTTQLVATFGRRDAGSGRWDERVVAIPLPVRFVATIEDAISPVRGPEADRAVREGLALRLMEMPTSKDLYFSARDVSRRELASVTLGLCAEVRDGEAVIGSARWWQRVDTPSSVGGVPIRLDASAPDSNSAALRRAIADASNPRYTVRVRGDGEMALRDFDGTSYWAGEFTMPLSELIRPPAKTPASGQAP